MLNDKKHSRQKSNQLKYKQKCTAPQVKDIQSQRKKINSSFGQENTKPNAKNNANSKNNPKQLEQQANRMLGEKKEMKLKIIDAVIKRHLHKLQLEGLIERLDKMKTKTKDAIEQNKDNTAKAYARKEKLIIRKEESQRSLDELFKEKLRIETLKAQKDAQIQMEDTELDSLKQKEDHLSQIKHTIDSDIYGLSTKITQVEYRHSTLFNELQQLKRKKDKNNSHRLEILTNIFTLKPFNKKLFILHNYLNDNHSSDCHHSTPQLVVNRNRKAVTIKNGINSQVLSFSFDHIISAIDNIYEEPSLLKNEREYIWSELLNIVNAYVNETDFLFILYLSHNSPKEINWSIIDLSKKILKQSSRPIAIKGLMNQSLFNISNDIAKEENIEKTLHAFGSIQGLVYIINNKDTKARIMIASFRLESEETSSMLSLLNEMNSKKKKDKSKLKQLLANHFLFSELNEVNVPFHSLTVFDTSICCLNESASNDLMIKLTQ